MKGFMQCTALVDSQSLHRAVYAILQQQHVLDSSLRQMVGQNGYHAYSGSVAILG